MFEDQVRILENPELRHVLAHLHAAIEAVAQGHPTLAQAELASIEGLVFYESAADADALLTRTTTQGGTDGQENEMHAAPPNEEERREQKEVT